jgi:ubiquinone/menaquinone biosynthesis C-methylase UbiE
VDPDEVKDGQRQQWAMGDYFAVALRFGGVAAHVLDACGVRTGDRLADVAAGTGNVAIAAARRGAVVSASDLTPKLVELGRTATAMAGREIDWCVADAEDLPYEDGAFDHVTSAFGLMFAPRPEVAAAEAFRILRPGGTLAIATWTPDGYLGQMGRVIAEIVPPPADGPPAPNLWGVEETARERLAPHAAEIRFERGMVRWEYASLEDGREFQETNFPNLAAARQWMEPAQYTRLVDTMMAFAAEHNLADDGRLVNDVEYLLAVASSPA